MQITQVTVLFHINEKLHFLLYLQYPNLFQQQHFSEQTLYHRSNAGSAEVLYKAGSPSPLSLVEAVSRRRHCVRPVVLDYEAPVDKNPLFSVVVIQCKSEKACVISPKTIVKSAYLEQCFRVTNNAKKPSPSSHLSLACTSDYYV